MAKITLTDVRSMKRLGVAAVGIALIASACTGGGGRATVITTTTTEATVTSVAPTTTSPLAGTGLLDAAGTSVPDELADAVGGIDYGPPAVDRIVVTTADGSIVIIDPDGTNEIFLHTEEDGAVGDFPVWAPNGKRIAWSTAGTGAFGEPEFNVISADVDGTNRVTMSTPFASYYSAWDSSSSVLAVLGNDETGSATALAVGLADRDSEATTLDVGAPTYYFTWDATGPGLIAHTAEGLRLVNPGQEPQTLGTGQGLYQPPLVTGEPGVMIFGQGGDSLSVIRRGSLLTGEVTNLAAYQGNLWMMMHPGGNHIAVQTSGRFSEPDPATDPTLPDDIPFLEPGVKIINLATSEITDVDDDPVVGFFWSPDGQKLLLADFEPVDGQSFMQWKVYENGETRLLGELFSPSTIFGGRIIPFFDQYGLSSALWSPDSTRFTYSGRNFKGVEGVWVYDLAADTAEMVYAHGTLAFWSPT